MKTPRSIVDEAIAQYSPVALYVGFSGGRDSIAVTHWMMTNVPGCRVFHCNTGIGIERSRQFVRDTCKGCGWPLDEVRAKEDCGQDYEAIVMQFGFPGPASHQMMYSRLKERAIRVLVRRSKRFRSREKVLLASGARHDESLRRMRYASREISVVGAQVWVNPIYWWGKNERDAYIALHDLPINPIAQQLGMSGECLCGAFAHPGEKEMIRAVCPETAMRIDRIERSVLAAGFSWGWEGRPPKGGERKDAFRPLCVGCEKSAVVKDAL